MAVKEKAAEAALEPRFTKEALLNAKRFRKNHDLVSAVLEDGNEYTIAEAEAKIENYMKGKVK